MTRRVAFHHLASAEIIEAQLWYEDRTNGLGDRFLGSLRSAIDRIASAPSTGSPTRVDEAGAVLERRTRVPGFPYVVVYRSTRDAIDVLAVHHERRRPLYWAER